MAPTTLQLLGLLASMTASTLALPAAGQGLRCADFGECVEVDVFGYRTQRLVNSTISDISLKRRQDDTNTNVEVGADMVEQITSGTGDGDPPPAAFGDLWDRIREACYATTCDEDKPVVSGDHQLTATGQFASEEARDHFIDLLREAFFRTVTTENGVQTVDGPVGPGGSTAPSSSYKTLTTRGVDFLNANIFGGANSGQFMTVRITQVQTGAGCPDYLNAINAAGALVPGLEYFFGGIATVCAALGS